METTAKKPAEASRPTESHILINCSSEADSTRNILRLNSSANNYIQLKSGWNILTTSDYPDLKYGFRPAMFKHYPIRELNPNCQAVLEVDLSHFDASEVISTERMFLDMSNLQSVDLSGVKFEHVETMNNMFYRCLSLKNIIQNTFDTFYSKSLTSAEGMFFSSTKLTKLSLPYLAHSGVKNIRDIFMGMESLQILDISGWDLRGVALGNVGGTESMFDDNHNLSKIYAIGCNEYTRSKLISQRERSVACYPFLVFALNIQKR